jgi:predicted metalloprotease
MRWTPGGESDDIEDRRGESAGDDGAGGGPPGFSPGPFSRGGGIPIRMGLGGTVVVLLLSVFFGHDFLGLLGGGADVPGPPPPAPRAGASRDQGQPGVGQGARRGLSPTDPDRELVEFVSFVLDDAQKTWAEQLAAEGKGPYRRAKLVLFTDAVRSGCGFAESAMGPFYCPVDRRVYIDLGFYRELRTRYGAPGDFAQAYVIAHEIGHHIQNLIGTTEIVERQREGNPGAANRLSVRVELQADCYAGIWAHSTEQRKLLESGDIEEGIGAAAAVGDDRLQRQATGHVNPERWTHGSSAERVAWFKRGLEAGRLRACDTFSSLMPP